MYLQNPSQMYRRVQIKGRFKPEKYWLKENQVLNGQLGYHVIMPFESVEGELVAVDRGWVAGSPFRDFVPEIETPEREITISGSLIDPSDSKLIREADVSAKTWPHKVLEVDLPVFSAQIQQHLYVKLLRLEADSPSAFDVYWRPINMSPAKHVGYAVQWFLLAAVLIILYIFASTNIAEYFKKKKK